MNKQKTLSCRMLCVFSYAPIYILLSCAPLAFAEETSPDQSSGENSQTATVEPPISESLSEGKQQTKTVNMDERVSTESVDVNTTDTPKSEPETAIAKDDDDPVLKACKNAKPGESVTIDGMAVICSDDKKKTEVFDFQAAAPIEQPSNGFVGFSDQYLNGFYLITGFGYANYSSMVSYADLDRTKDFFKERYGYTDTTATGIAHGIDVNIGLGYIANRFVLIELGYSYLGATGITGTTADSDGVNTYDYSSSATMSSLDISTIARYKLNDLVLLPITNTIHVMAIVEAHQWKRVTTIQYPDINNTGTTSGFGFSLGLGGDFQINKFLTVRSVWKYKTIADEGISTVMMSMVMKNNTRYAQAIQNAIINPIKNLW